MHRSIIKSCALFLSVLLVTASLAACGSEPQDKAGTESSSTASSADTDHSIQNTPEAVPLAEEGKAVVAADTSITAKTAWETPVLSQRGGGEQLKMLVAGETVSVEDIGSSLWYTLSMEDGTLGYVYAEDLYRVSPDGGTAAQSLAQEVIQSRLQKLKVQFPDGKYWNHMGQDLPYGQETPFSVSDEPCDHDIYGELYCNIYNGKTLELFSDYGYLCQCLGFASLLSDQLFGAETPIYEFYDYDQLRVGDQIRLNEYEHSMVVVEKTDDYVTVAEANADYLDCLISWTRQLTRGDLDDLSWDLEYISRYPQYRDSEGNLVNREEISTDQSIYQEEGYNGYDMYETDYGEYDDYEYDW